MVVMMAASGILVEKKSKSILVGDHLVSSNSRRIIDDSYAIEGIELAECRAIFFGWVLGLSADVDIQQEIRNLLKTHGKTHVTHPMTSILMEGVAANTERPTRRAQR